MLSLTAKGHTWIKTQPFDSRILAAIQKIKVKKNTKIVVKRLLDAPYSHYAILMMDGITRYIFKSHWQITLPKTTIITTARLRKGLRYISESNSKLYASSLNMACIYYKITTPPRIKAFLAQLAHESGYFQYDEELSSGIQYENRKDLGNINPGDGRKYKGRGLIQLTGRHNYTKASAELGVDLIDSPGLAKTPLNSTMLASWYWDSRGLNFYADKGTVAAFKYITYMINGGLNGWDHRLSIYNYLCRHWE